MILISHRGNVNGPSKDLENKVETIESTIRLGYDVEIDLWYINNSFYLGHDNPDTLVSFDFLDENKNKLWIHCKNLECLDKLHETNFNYFWHDKDLSTITSKGIFWSLNGYYLKNGVTVELDIIDEVPKNIFGICTDYVNHYQKIIK
jgi:hypothetical protein